ncbi:hypothetical protein [Amycolatopsis sp. WGS_07]|uniref:hypothetical protein n=1 Tax=Amycolatopsis sp. WGS_07 TaxID=3076764 RepID=UPI0038733DDA
METSREIRVRLPHRVQAHQYASIVHAVAAVLHTAGLMAGSSIVVDKTTRDGDLNDSFDQFSALYPWSDR